MTKRTFVVSSAALLIGVSIVINSVAATSFDRANTLKEELRLNHVDGKKEEAIRLAAQLAQAPIDEPFIQATLQDELRGLDAKVTEASMDKAIKFITGRKRELYCADQGLVEMTAEHNDGSSSRLVLIRSNRKMKAGSYALIEDGDWAFELSNSYRRPSISELWMLDATPSSFHVKEVRNRANGNPDTGEFISSWTNHRQSTNFGSQSEGHEPLPVHMAADYQLWGNSDMGFKINFQPGYKDTQEDHVTGPAKDFHLKSERIVGELVPKVTIKDSAGTARDYRNCYPVKYQISLKQLVDRQLEVDGKMSQDAILKVIKKNRKPIRACYNKALRTVPNLRGTITVKWDIWGGSTMNVRSSGRSLYGDGAFAARNEMNECILESVRSWKFPVTPDNEVTHVSYPFSFEL